MKKNSRIFVAGHNGMVGSAIVRRLSEAGYVNLILKSSSELDLRDQFAVQEFFATHSIEYVFLSAAKVGGIYANNNYPADFLYDNLQIQLNVIHQSYRYGVTKLLFLGSSCIYPKYAEQPIKEEALMTGALEKTNEAYAVAKIAGIKMCQAYTRQYGCNFISLMPTNLYGPNDNYNLENAHVLPALIRKIFEAKVNDSPTVEIWGTGSPRREFLHVDDLAEACLFLMETYNKPEIINVGTGVDLTIRRLAEIIMESFNYRGQMIFNTSQPDGTPRKLLDISRITSLGWKPKINLHDGIKEVCLLYSAKFNSVLTQVV
jgi:GDP-L-fucose synthase